MIRMVATSSGTTSVTRRWPPNNSLKLTRRAGPIRCLSSPPASRRVLVSLPTSARQHSSRPLGGFGRLAQECISACPIKPQGDRNECQNRRRCRDCCRIGCPLECNVGSARLGRRFGHRASCAWRLWIRKEGQVVATCLKKRHQTKGISLTWPPPDHASQPTLSAGGWRSAEHDRGRPWAPLQSMRRRGDAMPPGTRHTD
jgi:hypothetical protein